MLKSIVHEIIGTPRREPDLPQSLEQFRDRKRVLIIFADAQDDRALIQDEWLRKAHMRLIEEDVEVFSIAGGGAFALFDDDWELDADDIRERLQGPPSGEFGLILIGRDGTVKLRSSEPSRKIWSIAPSTACLRASSPLRIPMLLVPRRKGSPACFNAGLALA